METGSAAGGKKYYKFDKFKIESKTRSGSDITKFNDKDTFCCNTTKEYNIRVSPCAISISTVLLTIILGMYTDLIIEISNLYFFHRIMRFLYSGRI